MAESKRTRQRIADRQGFAQTWDDAQVQHREANAEPWEGDRVFEVKPVEAPIEPPPAAPPREEPPPRERLKVRHPVLEMVRTAVRRDGFTHPADGNFVMLPKEFGAIISLEDKCVLQIIYHIMCETIGWADPDGRAGRREWVQLGHADFTLVCGSKSQGDRGVKEALQRGYVIRRPCGNSYEYSIRWKES